MGDPILDLEAREGRPFQPHQRAALADALDQVAVGSPLRLCLYHRTGAGKTLTSLACVALTGAREATVMAPPITHDAWVEQGRRLGMVVNPISHAKFRQKGYKLASRDVALIVDEFHLLGGQTGKGWDKLRRLAGGLRGPLVIASATPNYNDAERVYCIWHILDPNATKGGFLQFLYQHCITLENPFGKMPLVEGFLKYPSAEEFLRELPRVHYVEDEAIKQLTIADVPAPVPEFPELEDYGLDRRRGRICASQMEERHARKRLQLIADDGLIRPEVYELIAELVGQVATPTLIFCESSTIAEALHRSCVAAGAKALVLTGKVSKARKQAAVTEFRTGQYDVLIGTATLATGTDGVDKMCDHLLIVDDTTDGSLRRQLMGRILPRGLDTDMSKKVVTRLTYP